MVPAWCHLCWHLELTAWKVHSGVLLHCLKPLLPFRASSLSSACPISCRQRCLCYTCWHLLPLDTAQSALQSSYPNPPIFSRSPPSTTNRLLCNPPGLQLPSRKQLRINLTQCILYSFFWCESSWSTGTECLWSRRLDRMTSRDPCQTMCFYQSENSRKCWLSPKLNFRHDSSDPTGIVLYSISKLTKLLHRKYTSKELALLVRCWCIYSCTFIRKLLLYL